jgi:hypothetical protein
MSEVRKPEVGDQNSDRGQKLAIKDQKSEKQKSDVRPLTSDV